MANKFFPLSLTSNSIVTKIQNLTRLGISHFLLTDLFAIKPFNENSILSLGINKNYLGMRIQNPMELNFCKQIKISLIEILIESKNLPDWKKALTETYSPAYFAQFGLWLVLRNLQLQEIRFFLKELPSYLHPQICFEFTRSEHGAFTKAEMHITAEILRILSKEFPHVKFQGPTHRDYEDLRRPEIGIEQIPNKATFSNLLDSQPIEHSIIIPTYNNMAYTLQILRHILDNKYNQNSYEIIFVDDGSLESASPIVQSYVLRNHPRANVSYYYWPRPTFPSKELFRAGLCRNLGSHYAKGKNLIFLDSDILIGPEFLNQVQQGLEQADILQFARYHLPPKLSLEYLTYQSINQQKDTYIEEPLYWGKLYRANNWKDLDCHWKYTCSYCLALSKANFEHLGGYRINFYQYGFEDTDIGYQMAISGKRFHLNLYPCFHLTKKSNTVFSMLFNKRKKRLKYTAQNFYLQYLDPQIYEELKSLIY